jgi:hypothetical protein
MTTFGSCHTNMPRSSAQITIADLYLAYRKAKAEAFYENTHFHAAAYTKYEQKLDSNLVLLLARLNSPDPDWQFDALFIGDHAYLPKSIDESMWDNTSDGHFRALDPLDDWDRRFSKQKRRAEASLRLVIRPTVDFQIVSALWILKVGQKFDAVLDENVSFGNRLRRAAGNDIEFNGRSQVNLLTPSLFAPYFSAYQEWREGGLSAMEKSLEKGKDILAITMDIEKFYHRVAPDFILRPSFLKSINLRLTAAEKRFTTRLLDAIKIWYAATPDFKSRPEGAIPVGLSASKIIANVLLANFDEAILEQVKPVYYGRYVDDIFLVLEAESQDLSAPSVARRLADALSPMLKTEADNGGPPSLKLNFPYARDSELRFAGTKQKIFSLSSEHGADLVHYIRAQIRAQSSEYRLLPAVPHKANDMAARALLATPDATLQVDALRKADVVSVRRLGFALLLSDIETYAADLAPDTWRAIREQFYALAKRHIVTPSGFFQFFSYIPRVFGLMLASGDYADARALIKSLVTTVEMLKRTTNLGLRKEKRKFDLCLQQYSQALLQAGMQAASARIAEVNQQYFRVIREIKKLDSTVRLPGSLESLLRQAKQMLLADWGRRPYKDYWYNEQQENENGPPVSRKFAVRRQIRLGAIRRFRKEVADLKAPHWPALAFPTRPLTLDEIPLIAPRVLHDRALFEQAISALRGARVPSIEPLGFLPSDLDDKHINFLVPGRGKASVRVAATSRETTHQQWKAAAQNCHDRSLDRYEVFNGLLNKILGESKRPDYIVMPELTVPLRWALRAARKLSANGISFLAGVEYHRDRTSKKLRNDCLVSLTTRWPGYASHVIMLQSKFQPAHGERAELAKIGKKGKSMFIPTGDAALPTVYQHKNFFFSVLVCSDLTNISHRNELRGQVDALFALEWNQDTKTFSPLVEATASDLHAYVVQVNNRLYGDSRIRAPMINDYSRDVVQVKGGISDYYVLGDIEHVRLRSEQRRKGGDRKFKPAPIGYIMSSARKNEK